MERVRRVKEKPYLKIKVQDVLSNRLGVGDTFGFGPTHQAFRGGAQTRAMAIDNNAGGTPLADFMIRGPKARCMDSCS